MPLEWIGTLASRRPGWMVAAWLILAVAVGVGSPNLTKLAAEGQSKLLGGEAESRRAAELVKACWPDQAYESTAVAALHRPAGLTEADRRFATELARRFEAADRPPVVLRVLGPTSQPEIAARLAGGDGTTSLVIVPLDAANVAPSAPHRRRAVSRTISWTSPTVRASDRRCTAATRSADAGSTPASGDAAAYGTGAAATVSIVLPLSSMSG